jgi:hypothetical protein
MYLPFRKAVWLGEIRLSQTEVNLLVAHFEFFFKQQLVNAIGLNFYIVTASASFGIRVSKEKFRQNKYSFL